MSSIINEVIPEYSNQPTLADLKLGDMFRFEGASTIHIVVYCGETSMRTVDLARGKECVFNSSVHVRVFPFEKVTIRNIA